MSPWYLYDALANVRLSFVHTGIHAIRVQHVSYCFPSACARVDFFAFRSRQAKRETKFYDSFSSDRFISRWYFDTHVEKFKILFYNYMYPYAKHTLMIYVSARVGWYVLLRGRFLNTLMVKVKLAALLMLAKFYHVTYIECIKRCTYFII